MVSLFNMEDKSLSSKQNVRAAFVFLGTFFFLLRAIGKLRLGFIYCRENDGLKATCVFSSFYPSPSQCVYPSTQLTVSDILWRNETVTFNK